MNVKTLRKVKSELLSLQKSPHGLKPDVLVSIAKKLGRSIDNRGKEPTYIRDIAPSLSPPLSIPSHGSKDLKVGTAKNIINMLLDDVSEWELFLFENEDND